MFLPTPDIAGHRPVFVFMVSLSFLRLSAGVFWFGVFMFVFFLFCWFLAAAHSAPRQGTRSETLAVLIRASARPKPKPRW
jgi:hypothetical protein